MKDKELSKKRLLDAVGEIIRKEGFRSLNVSKVAKMAELDRKLIYRYFRNLDGLIEAYIVQHDYWVSFAEHFKELLASDEEPDTAVLITKILQDQFRYFLKEENMQYLVLMELTQNIEILQSIHHVREWIGQQIFERTDPHFDGGPVNFRAISALLVGGIYYIILHARFNGSQFADVDVASEKGRADLLRAIAQVVAWAFNAADGHEAPGRP